MKIPYNRVHTQGQVLFTARGGSIHTFKLTDGSHIATWKHPDVEKVASAIKAISEEASRPIEQQKPEGEAELEQGGEEDGPPAKRQKIVSEEGEDQSGETKDDEPSEVAKESKSMTKDPPKHNDGRGKRARRHRNKDAPEKEDDKAARILARVPDRPVITHLTSTTEGKHVLAITGHDKIVWVFEHDGEGNLKQLSQRTMPKRPSSVVISSDNQIICADKFGDVYALPLLITESSHQNHTPLSSLPLPAKKAFRPSANTFTVHSKKNREALQNQIQQAEQDSKTNNEAEGVEKSEAPGPAGVDFELSLLLGHVSMLTALTLGESQGRRFILTADRDEHIRVSRYMPQAHIIHTFCMGHKEFVNDLLIPPARGDILLSGGGDDSLFIWDWVNGTLLSKTNLVALAQEIAPETTKVAVSSLFALSYPSEEDNFTYILAICEDIKAIFSWRLTENNELKYPSIIQIPGKPLHLTAHSPPSSSSSTPESATAQPNPNPSPTLIAAIDPDADTSAKSLHAFVLTLNEGRLAVDVEVPARDEELDAEETEISEDEVRSLLYTVENLRKLSGGSAPEEAADDQDQPPQAASDVGDIPIESGTVDGAEEQ